MNLAQDILLMGVINVTPDSFSDGGKYFDRDAIIQQVEKLISDGAHIIDFGAESTRPQSTPVSPDEERRRLEIPFKLVASGRFKNTCFSIDSRHDRTILEAVAAGVTLVNNVAGLMPQEVLAKLAKRGNVSYLAMHMHREPQTMQQDPLGPSDAISAIEAFFATAQRQLKEAGFASHQIFIDPGVGFGKTMAANLQILSYCAEWSRNYNVAIGISRKSMFEKCFGAKDFPERDRQSKIAELFMAMLAGVKLIRTHNVQDLSRLLALLK